MGVGEKAVAVTHRPDTLAWLNEAGTQEYRDALKATLKRSKMTQAEFAGYCGCSASNISAVLSGRFTDPVPKYVWAAARRIFGEGWY